MFIAAYRIKTDIPERIVRADLHVSSGPATKLETTMPYNEQRCWVGLCESIGNKANRLTSLWVHSTQRQMQLEG